MDNRHIIFVPGKNPKPPPGIHREQLWRVLHEGLRRVDPACAEELQNNLTAFSLIAWNFSYYHVHADIERDLAWLDRLINKSAADANDIRQAKDWHVRFNWLLYSIADLMPWLIRWLPGPACATVRETRRYFNDTHQIGSRIREPLKDKLRHLLGTGQRVLLIGHSLGSVIAFDALWELSHLEQRSEKLDFLSLGSPLGMNFVQHRTLGHGLKGAAKFPANIRHWTNISAHGDITALDNDIRNDFAYMLKHGLVASMTNLHEEVYTWFRNDDGLNVHRSYGYLVNDVVAKEISKWWRENA
jgi:hypothetical protein